MTLADTGCRPPLMCADTSSEPATVCLLALTNQCNVHQPGEGILLIGVILVNGRGDRGYSHGLCSDVEGVSVGRFYAIPTARVMFTMKTIFDIFSLSQEQVWTFSVLGD